MTIVMAADAIKLVKQLDEQEFASFKQLFKQHSERRAMMMLDSFSVGDKVKFHARGHDIVATITKVAIKNLKAVEVTVDGKAPASWARRWTVAPAFCQRVQ